MCKDYSLLLSPVSELVCIHTVGGHISLAGTWPMPAIPIAGIGMAGMRVIPYVQGPSVHPHRDQFVIPTIRSWHHHSTNISAHTVSQKLHHRLQSTGKATTPCYTQVTQALGAMGLPQHIAVLGAALLVSSIRAAITRGAVAYEAASGTHGFGDKRVKESAPAQVYTHRLHRGIGPPDVSVNLDNLRHSGNHVAYHSSPTGIRMLGTKATPLRSGIFLVGAVNEMHDTRDVQEHGRATYDVAEEEAWERTVHAEAEGDELGHAPYEYKSKKLNDEDGFVDAQRGNGLKLVRPIEAVVESADVAKAGTRFADAARWLRRGQAVVGGVLLDLEGDGGVERDDNEDGMLHRRISEVASADVSQEQAERTVATGEVAVHEGMARQGGAVPVWAAATHPPLSGAMPAASMQQAPCTASVRASVNVVTVQDLLNGAGVQAHVATLPAAPVGEALAGVLPTPQAMATVSEALRWQAEWRMGSKGVATAQTLQGGSAVSEGGEASVELRPGASPAAHHPLALLNVALGYMKNKNTHSACFA
jgi:hypothetical protein